MNTDLTDLTAIRQRAEAASVGPWIAYGFEIRTGDIAATDYIATVAGPFHGVDEAETQKTAEFIAHARQDIPDLLDRIDALERALVMARSALGTSETGFYRSVRGTDYRECVECDHASPPTVNGWDEHESDCDVHIRRQALTEIAGILE